MKPKITPLAKAAVNIALALASWALLILLLYGVSTFIETVSGGDSVSNISAPSSSPPAAPSPDLKLFPE